jgi:hypothetical protein
VELTALCYSVEHWISTNWPFEMAPGGCSVETCQMTAFKKSDEVCSGVCEAAGDCLHNFSLSSVELLLSLDASLHWEPRFHRFTADGAPTHEIERQGRWKQGGGMVGRYTRGETAGSALRYL